MDLSVVVPTLNGRERLDGCLDALREAVPDAEVVVVNGPSTDGTAGVARDHPVVDHLLQIPERNLNAARNAGIGATGGDVVAMVSHGSAVEESWLTALRDARDAGAEVVAGPVHRTVEGGVTTEAEERTSLFGREVTFFDGGNVAFTRAVVEALDGFDEYLEVGAARDAAHRLAGMGVEVRWTPEFSVLRTEGNDIPSRMAADPGASVRGPKYRSLAYRLTKNYGLRWRTVARPLRHAAVDAGVALRDVVRGDRPLASWAHTGLEVGHNLVSGTRDGLLARRADPSSTRNPHGVSARVDRTVVRHEA
ncbi:MAG: glycosyltransferase family 2 protein [Halobacteriaceae archaeon]